MKGNQRPILSDKCIKKEQPQILVDRVYMTKGSCSSDVARVCVVCVCKCNRVAFSCAAKSANVLLLKGATDKGKVALLEAFPQELVDGKGDGLAGGDTHDARGDALVKGVEALLLEHVGGDLGDADPGADARPRG